MPDITIDINQTPVTITPVEVPVTLTPVEVPVTIDTDGGAVTINNTTTQVDIDFGGPQGPQGPQGPAADFSATITAGENLSARDMIYIDASGSAMKADNASALKQATGYVTAAITSGNTGTGYFGGGMIEGFAGLTLDTPYYLGTSGAITTTKPVSGFVQQIGFPLSSSILIFHPSIALGL